MELSNGGVLEICPSINVCPVGVSRYNIIKLVHVKCNLIEACPEGI